ncbi:hypothetical protein NEQG_01564 [Nematocida parisii ERTm3]|uniref:Uncharacterized protein n=1 Tax=Nematocida parisii (strain ERTm3) TaxID=935791 RepID=I3EFX3_NEMP3|nr:hypothetical protein NEQG_01564 [Nematocida parisii ERTm3]
MESVKLQETLMKSVIDGYSIKGINLSLISAGVLFSYTERGKLLVNTLKSGAIFDFIIFTTVITLSIMKIISYVYKYNIIYSKQEKNNLARIETYLGIFGIMILGVLGNSPLFIILSVVSSVILNSNYKFIITLLITGGLLFLGIPLLTYPCMYNIIISMGISLCLLGMFRLESIIKNDSINMYVHYFILISIVIGGFIYSPITFILLPMVLFIYMNINNKYIHGVYSKYKGILLLLIKITKVLIITVIITLFTVYFSAWYTDNPIILRKFIGVEVSKDSPVFIMVLSSIKYIIDMVVHYMNIVIMSIRPKSISDYILKSIDISTVEVSHSSNIFKQIISVVYKAFMIIDNILVYVIGVSSSIVHIIASIVCYIVIRPISIYNNIIRIITNGISYILYMIDTALYYVIGRHMRMVDKPVVKDRSILSKAVSIILYPLTIVKYLFKSKGNNTGNTTVVNKGNLLTSVYGIIVHVLYLLLGGYSWLFFITNGKDMVSEKSYEMSKFGFTPVMRNSNVSVPDEVLYYNKGTFYQKFFDTYCEYADVYDEINGNGAYSEESITKHDSYSVYDPMQMYSKDQVCTPISSYETELRDKIKKLGPINIKLTDQEFAGMRSILQYFPCIQHKKGLSQTEKSLMMKLEDKKKILKDPKKAPESTLKNILGIKPDSKKQQATADKEYRKALSKMADYYRKYYYNFYILGQYFLDNINSSVSNCVSDSIIKMYNKIIPVDYSEITDEYLKTIVQVRTAIIRRELPFLTEAQSALVFYTPVVYNLGLDRSILSAKNKGTLESEGFFLENTTNKINYNEVFEENTDLFVYHNMKELNVEEQVLRFKSTVSTCPNPVGAPFTITRSNGIDLYIHKNDSTVVSVSVNNRPVVAKAIPYNKAQNVCIDLELPLDSLKEYTLSNPKSEEIITITVRMFIGHVSLVSTRTHEIKI